VQPSAEQAGIPMNLFLNRESIKRSIYHFLLVINNNLSSILPRFRHIVFDRSKIAIFDYPLAFNPPRRIGSPGTMAKVLNGIETLPKISTG